MDIGEVEEGRRRPVLLLHEASVSGSVSLLEQLMADDPLTLARAAVTCFNETPLHIAAMLDHLDFALFLLNHKPDMTTALDSRGQSPLHLASSNGYLHMVDALLSANPDACLIQNEDGMTPLHLAVMKGETEIVRKLFEARPEVIRFNSDHQGETTLHLAVKHNRLRELKLLLELLGGDHHQHVQFLNSRDDYGNTLLHTATALKQFVTVKYLVERAGMEVNAENENGLTALDIILNMSRDMKGVEIRECLVKAGALSCRDMAGERGSVSSIQMVKANPQSHLPTHGANVTVKEEGKAAAAVDGQRGDKAKKEWTKKKRDSVMIAATLIAGMTFQIAVNPPGGVWDQDKGGGILAGKSVMAHRYPAYYNMFMTWNTMSFFGSLSMVFLVVSGVPFLKRRILTWILMILMWIILTFMAMTYWLSMVIISLTNDRHLEVMLVESYPWPDIIDVVRVSAFVWKVVVGAVVLVHIIRFLLYCLPKLFWCLRKIFKGVINTSSGQLYTRQILVVFV